MKPLPSLMPALYSHRLAEIQSVAHEYGYAIAVHGSMQRDLDLVAIPWTDNARENGELMNAMAERLGLAITDIDDKPHGRKAITFLMGGACFMDLSILPTLDNRE